MDSGACDDVDASPMIIFITIFQGKADKKYSYYLETKVQKWEKKGSHVEWQLELQCLGNCAWKVQDHPPIWIQVWEKLFEWVSGEREMWNMTWRW